MKRFLNWSVVLLMAIMAVSAFAQEAEDAAEPAEDEAVTAEFQEAVEAMFDACVKFSRSDLEAAIDEDAEILVYYSGTEFLGRDEFIGFVGTNDLSSLKVSDVDVRVIQSVGFAEVKIEIPGFVNGFMYGVFAKDGVDGSWVLQTGVIDPMAGMMTDGQIADVEDATETFGDEMLAAVGEGDFAGPMIERINEDHAICMFGIGDQVMTGRGYDEVVGQLQFAAGMAGEHAGDSAPEIPEDVDFESLPFPAGQIIGNSMLVLWLEPTIPIMGNDTTLRAAIIGVVKDGDISVVACVAALDLDPAAMGMGG